MEFVHWIANYRSSDAHGLERKILHLTIFDQKPRPKSFINNTKSTLLDHLLQKPLHCEPSPLIDISRVFPRYLAICQASPVGVRPLSRDRQLRSIRNRSTTASRFREFPPACSPINETLSVCSTVLNLSQPSQQIANPGQGTLPLARLHQQIHRSSQSQRRTGPIPKRGCRKHTRCWRLSSARDIIS